MNSQKRAELERRKAFIALQKTLRVAQLTIAEQRSLLNEGKRVLSETNNLLINAPVDSKESKSVALASVRIARFIDLINARLDRPGTGRLINTIERPRPQTLD